MNASKICRFPRLDPIDCVQPTSRTTCVAWLARFTGTDVIHAVCHVPYHTDVEVEESSVKLEFPRLKVQIEDKQVLYPLLVGSLTIVFVRVEIIACNLF